ncbi:DNA-directed RNA polymerase III subunit rpc4 [Termitomyces sp. T112]|nr:DNA-directed RNA polymerase III subunit rpc4 [Termitomyces sp. T112]
MSDAPAASGSGSSISPTKAIGSLAKKQSDVTRQGAQKLKFVPTLPARRKKEEVKPEPVPAALPPAPTNERGRGRGRGRGDASGRGRGRGVPPVIEMTASGPFAMGPALAGQSATRRAMPRSNFAPVATGSAPSLGSSLVRGAAPTLKREGGSKAKETKEEDDAEVYSDPDEGVEIVDMEDIRNMDWMAPESLRKEKQQKKVKKEEISRSGGGTDVNAANALDLSDSGEEEELEDIIEHFATAANTNEQDSDLREERLYLFQFPSPFPTFVSPDINLPAPAENVVMAEGTPTKKVAFADNVKSEAGTPDAPSAETETTQSKVDGVIGRLEVYRSGAVKMRLANGIVLDVTAATQPSFLQQAAHLDKEGKRLIVLGEVNKRFSVSPDVDTLLSAMEMADKEPTTPFDNEDLIQMDTT